MSLTGALHINSWWFHFPPMYHGDWWRLDFISVSYHKTEGWSNGYTVEYSWLSHLLRSCSIYPNEILWNTVYVPISSWVAEDSNLPYRFRVPARFAHPIFPDLFRFSRSIYNSFQDIICGFAELPWLNFIMRNMDVFWKNWKQNKCHNYWREPPLPLWKL